MFCAAFIALSLILLPAVFGERCWKNCSQDALVLDCSVISDASVPVFSSTLAIGPQSNATATLTVRVAPLLWINITTFPTAAADTTYYPVYDFSVELRNCAAATGNITVVMGNVVRVALVVRNSSLQRVVVQGDSTYSGVYVTGGDIAPTTYHSRTANLSTGIAAVGGTHYGLDLLLTNITLRYPVVGKLANTFAEMVLISNSQLRTSVVDRDALSIAFIGVAVAHWTRLLTLAFVQYHGFTRHNHTDSANISDAVPRNGVSIVMSSVTQVYEGIVMPKINATNANLLYLFFIVLLAFQNVTAAADAYGASTAALNIDVSNVSFYVVKCIVWFEGCDLGAFRFAAQHTVCEAHCSPLGISESNLTGPVVVVMRDSAVNSTAVEQAMVGLSVIGLGKSTVCDSLVMMIVRLNMIAIVADFSMSSFVGVGIGDVVFRGGAVDIWIVNSTIRQEFLGPPLSPLGVVSSTAAVAITSVTYERNATRGVSWGAVSFISVSLQDLGQDAEYARNEISRALLQTKLSNSSGGVLGHSSSPHVAQVAIIHSTITCSASAISYGISLAVSLVAGNISSHNESFDAHHATRNAIMVVVTNSIVRTTAVASSAAVSVTVEGPSLHEFSCPRGTGASATDFAAAYAMAMWGSTFVTTIAAPPMVAWSTYANTLIVKGGGVTPSLCSAGVSLFVRLMRCSAAIVRPVLWTGQGSDRTSAFVNSRAYLSAHILLQGLTNCEIDMAVEGEQFRLQNATLSSTVALWAIVGSEGSRVRVHDTYCPTATLHIVNASFSMFTVNGSTFDIIEVAAPGYFRNSELRVGAEQDTDGSRYSSIYASAISTSPPILVGRINVGSDYFGSSVAVCNATVSVAHMNVSVKSAPNFTFVTVQKLTTTEADSAGGLCAIEVSARNLVMGPLQTVVLLSDCVLRGFGNVSVTVENVEYADFAAAPLPLTIFNAATWVESNSYVLCVTRCVVASLSTTLTVRRVRVMRAGSLLRIYSTNFTNFEYIEPAAVLLQVTNSACRQHCTLLASTSVGLLFVKAMAFVKRCTANMSATTILTPLLVSSITAAREASVFLSDGLVSFTGQGDVALSVEECTLRYRVPSGFSSRGVAVIGLGMFGIRESQIEIVCSSILTVVEPGAFALTNAAVGVTFQTGSGRLDIANSSLAVDGGLSSLAAGFHAPAGRLSILSSALVANTTEDFFFSTASSLRAAAVALGERFGEISSCAVNAATVVVVNSSLESYAALKAAYGFACGILVADYCNISLSVHMNTSTSNSLLLTAAAAGSAHRGTAVFLSFSWCRIHAMDVVVTHSVLVSRVTVENVTMCRSGCTPAISTNVLMSDVSFGSDEEHPQRPTAVIAIRYASLAASVFSTDESRTEAALSFVSNVAFSGRASNNHTARIVLEVLNSTLLIHDNITTSERYGLRAFHVYVDPIGIASVSCLC